MAKWKRHKIVNYLFIQVYLKTNHKQTNQFILSPVTYSKRIEVTVRAELVFVHFLLSQSPGSHDATSTSDTISSIMNWLKHLRNLKETTQTQWSKKTEDPQILVKDKHDSNRLLLHYLSTAKPTYYDHIILYSIVSLYCYTNVVVHSSYKM